MADNTYNPTAANILSSLHIKGASVTGGAGKDGYVPVLGSEGKLDASVIDLESISGNIDILPLKKVAFVDANSRKPAEQQTGSISSPFKSLAAASVSSIPESVGERYCNFILMPGNYGNESASISSPSGSRSRIFCAGSVSFGTLQIGEYLSGTVFELHNVHADMLTFFSQPCTVIAYGACNIGTLAADGTSVTAMVSPECEIGSISGNVTVLPLAKDSRIENTVTSVPGATVRGAMESLAARKIKIPVFTVDADGIHADSADFEDVSVPSGGDTYVITRIGTTLATAANGVFHKDGDSPSYGDLAAEKVTANSVVTAETATGSVKFLVQNEIKAVLKVDSSDFLVIA